MMWQIVPEEVEDLDGSCGREEGPAEAASHRLYLTSSYTTCHTDFAQLSVLQLFPFWSSDFSKE